MENYNIPAITTPKEFSELMRCSVQTIRNNYLHRKDFPAFQVGRLWKIKTEEAIKYMEDCNHG